MAEVIRGGRWAPGAEPSGHEPSTSIRNHSRDGQESLQPVEARRIMAFVQQKSFIGVAVFLEEESELLWDHVATDRDYEIVRRIKSSVSPALIVMPAPLRSNPAFMNIVREGMEVKVDSTVTPGIEKERGDAFLGEKSIDEDYTSDENGRIPVRFVPGVEFSQANATQNIALVNLIGMPNHLSPLEKVAFLSHSIDQECDLAFRAVGGLIGFLLTECILNSLERPDEPVCLNGIRQCNFGDVMYLSRGTFRALQVFQLDSHPLGHGSGRSKEGLSLYGVINKTKSVVGGRLLRRWVASPSTDFEVIRERQLFVSLLRSPAQDAVLATLGSTLIGVKNVPSILNRLRTVSAGINDWHGLEKSGRSLLSMHDAIQALCHSEPKLSETNLIQRLELVQMAHIRDAVKWVSSVIDFPESKLAGRPVIVAGFSDEIDQLRECFSGLDDYLTRIGVQEMGRIARETSLRIPRLQVVYLPQVGYLVLLGHSFLESTEATDAKLAEAGLEFMFSSPAEGGYFKSEQCYLLDAELGDIHGALSDLEAKAVRYLESKVLPSSLSFYQACVISAEFDCLLALAEASNEHGWVCPTVNPEFSGICIEAGRHALQELILPSFIPNSTNAKNGDVHVITGPNCSGKSVYCKQVALIVILAQIGSCVPATSCCLGIFDSLYTRISSHESVSINQSSFFIDASQVATMLHSCGQRSLVLLDEWGKGTAECDGMALFAATLSELLHRPKDESPICLSATHFTELMAEPFLPMSSERLGVFSMDILTETGKPVVDGNSPAEISKSPRANDLEQNTVFLYRLVPGSISCESLAIQCAQRAGVPRDILVRCVQIRDAVKTNSQLLPWTPSQNEEGRLEQIISAVCQFLEVDLDQISNMNEWLLKLPL